MARTELSFETLSELEGGEDAIAEFNRLILAAVKDCRDRSEIDKKRTVILKLTAEPDAENPSQVLVALETRHALPAKEAGMTRGNVDRAGHLIFNPAATDAPDQTTLDEAK